MKTAWHAIVYQEVLHILGSRKTGLSVDQAKKRLETHGFNELQKQKRFRLSKLFFRQFKSFFILFLVIAGIISYLIGDRIDSFIIFSAIILNVIFGFFQEQRAEKILSSLKKQLTSEAHILRDGEEKIISVNLLVPGDIIFLRQGDRVPADIRMIYAKNLSTDEAALTGESMPISKHANAIRGNVILAERRNMVYQGTLITSGEGEGVVVETGRNTEMGKISVQLSEDQEGPTLLQKKITQLSQLITFLVGIAFLVIFIDGLWVNPTQIKEVFTMAVAVAISAIPESLIIAMTVILALGMRNLSKKKAYLRRLAAAETLGRVTLILTDKTGTLTEAQMAVDNIFCQGTKNEILMYRAFILANSARVENPKDNFADWRYVGTPTEKALLKKALAEGEKKLYFKRESLILDALFFDSSLKFQTRLIKEEKENALYLIGAPEKILEKCGHFGSKDKLKDLRRQSDELASQGLRVLGVAYKKTSSAIESFIKDDIRDLTFLGLVSLKDPLRPKVKNSIALTKKAGIKTVIVTGDHALTAQAIANDLDFNVTEDEILSGDEISRLSEHELKLRLKKIKVFARVSPYDKVRILEAYQKQGEVVAMTGDGINDALALKQADIGIALGSGQEVARESADLVLFNNNFSNIVAAIRAGRVIFDNIQKVIVFLLSDCFSELLLVASSFIFGLPLPLLASQILWINLIGDCLPDFALALEPGEKGLMQRKPRPAKEPFLSRQMKFIIFVVGLVTDLLLFGLFCYLIRQGKDIAYVRTMVFCGLSIDTFFIVLAVKSLRQPFFKIKIFNNPYLIVSVLIGFSLLVATIYLPIFQKILQLKPLRLSDWLIILGLGLLEFLGIEFSKWMFNRDINSKLKTQNAKPQPKT